jgi:hypothetical protein
MQGLVIEASAQLQVPVRATSELDPGIEYPKVAGPGISQLSQWRPNN